MSSSRDREAHFFPILWQTGNCCNIIYECAKYQIYPELSPLKPIMLQHGLIWRPLKQWHSSDQKSGCKCLAVIVQRCLWVRSVPEIGAQHHATIAGQSIPRTLSNRAVALGGMGRACLTVLHCGENIKPPIRWSLKKGWISYETRNALQSPDVYLVLAKSPMTNKWERRRRKHK